MTDNKKIDPMQLDKRVMERFVRNKKVTSKEVEQYLNSLPDLAQQAEDISNKIYGEKKGHGA